MPLEADVLAILESVPDKQVAAGLVVTLVRAAVALEAAAELRAAVERGKEDRRESERARKADYRERVRMSRAVPGTDGDTAGQDGTKRDTGVSPLHPPSPSSLSLLPDPERAIPPAPALLVFPVVGKETEWGLTAQLRDQQQAAFPHLDVMAEYRKCLAYVQANPAKRKTSRGMAAALFRWLSNAQESGRGTRRADAPQVRPRPVEVKPQPKTPPAARGWGAAGGDR